MEHRLKRKNAALRHFERRLSVLIGVSKVETPFKTHCNAAFDNDGPRYTACVKGNAAFVEDTTKASRKAPVQTPGPGTCAAYFPKWTMAYPFGLESSGRRRGVKMCATRVGMLEGVNTRSLSAAQMRLCDTKGSPEDVSCTFDETSYC